MNPIRILMVEDSPLDADLIKARLTAGQIEAEFLRVETREDFERAIGQHCYDLILADYSLPSFDGLSALAIARRTCADIPFIFVSGVLGEEVAVETLQKGATDYVLKQRLNRLVPAVRRALTEAHERAARRHAEEGLRIAAETARLGFWQYDVESDLMECSATYKAIFGLSPDQQADRRTLRDRIHPDDRAESVRRYDQAISNGGDYEAEYRVVWPGDGSVHWVVSRGRAIYAPNGKPARMVGVSIDITERKRAESELREAKETAEAASRAKDHFLAVLSHELRTPLSPILTTLHLLEIERLSPEAQEYIDVIRRNVELEARLIDDLLDLTRISRGKLQLHTEPADLHTLITRTLEICNPDAVAKRQTITVDRNATNSIVQGDPARLQQVLWNLLKNAIKFTPAGGAITLRTYNTPSPTHGVPATPGQGFGRPSDRSAAPDSFPPSLPTGNSQLATSPSLTIEVSDTGIGLDPAAASRIFNAFEQADHLVTRQYGGLGLGLAIAKALVEMHGGALACSSPGPNQGSTFSLTLPTATPQQATSHTPHALNPQSAIQNPQSLKILLVEDHPDTARAMSSLLKIRGHSVRHATTVTAALGLAGAEPFDLLISDLGLPDGTGIDVIRQSNLRVPAIALTGYGSDDDIARCRAAGFSHHLTKPVSFDKLEAAIKQLTPATPAQ